jgi:hypothetical protein
MHFKKGVRQLAMRDKPMAHPFVLLFHRFPDLDL